MVFSMTASIMPKSLVREVMGEEMNQLGRQD